MTQIAHCPFHRNVDYWDYYILCHLNIDAARILARMEYWDSTKAGGIPHAEAINDRLEEAGEAATQDTSRFVFKGEEELYWELMGSCGEKNIPRHLSFLVEDLKYLVSRRNPFKRFDRTKQYEFQEQLIRGHISKLRVIIEVFLKAGRRLTPVQYAVEKLTAEGVYIDTLSVELVGAKLLELHVQAQQDELNGTYEKGKKPVKAVLPKFIRLALKKDEQNGFSAISPFRKTSPSFPHFAEMKEAKCGIDSADRTFGFRILPPTIPVITTSNDESIMTTSGDITGEATVAPTSTQSANTSRASLPFPLDDLTSEETELVVKMALERRRQCASSLEVRTLAPTQQPQPTQEVAPEGSMQRGKQTGDDKRSGRNRVGSSKRTTPKSEVVLTLHGQHIIELYQVFKGRKVMLTEDTVTAANHLGEFVGRDEDFSEVLKAIAADDFLRQKKVRWDLDYVYRHYDEFFDIVERNRGKQPPGVTGDEMKTDYNEVMGMTDEQRAEYARRQREKQRFAGVDREILMKMPPEGRIAYLRQIREQQHPAVAATSA